METTKPKVLILTVVKHAHYAGSIVEKDSNAWCETLEKNSPETAFFSAAVSDLAIKIQDGSVTIRDLRNECALEDYAFVQFRNLRLARDYFMAVAQYLTHHKVPFTDANDVLGTAFDKISQMVKFALNNITVPDTLAVWPRTTVVDVQQFTQLPFIMKSNDGIKGLNNYLVQSWDEFETLLQAHGSNGYLVQPFIPNDGDYRFLYIGNELLAFFRQAQGKTHLNNSSQGGTGSLVEIPTCDPAVVRIAQQAMQCYAREISGVDVLVDKTTNKPYILEVNYTPAIPSGLFQEEKIKCYAQFVQTKIKGES